MNFRTTIILLVVLVLVGVAVLFVRHKEENAPTETANSKKLIDLEPADVTRVVITPGGGQRIVLERATGGAGAAPAGGTGAAANAEWRLVEPFAAPAQAFEVDGLVRDLVGLQSRTQGEADKKAMGLEQPAYTVQLTGKGKDVQIAVGNKSLVGDVLYVQVAGHDKPDIVPAGRIVEELDRPAAEYRSKKLVDATATQIQQITIDQPGQPQIHVEKSGAEWQVTAPAQFPADSTAVSDLTMAIGGLNADTFASQQPSGTTSSAASSLASYGLTRPQMTVLFSTAAPATRPSTQSAVATTGPTTAPAAAMTEIRFGRAEDITQKNVYATVLPPGTAAGAAPIARVPMTSLNSFKKTPLDLRDKKVLEIKPDDVSEITLSVDRPATTQPTSKPAEQKTLHIARRKENLALGPSFTAAGGPTTGPATAPTTGPTTGPETQPSTTEPSTTQPATTQAAGPEKPKGKWVIESEGDVNADDTQVTELLDALHPLRATKYLEKAPTTQPSPTYVLQVKTVGAGGAATAGYELRVTDMGTTNPPVVQYRDLTFEVDRSILRKLEGDFKTKRPPETPAMPPSFPGGPGGFPGGLPPGAE